jgi:hypothetical protein
MTKQPLPYNAGLLRCYRDIVKLWRTAERPEMTWPTVTGASHVHPRRTSWLPVAYLINWQGLVE